MHNCLALGYAGGVGAFQSMASVYGVDVSDEEAENIKTKWRNSNKAIVSFWYDLERAALTAMRTGEAQHVGDKGIAFKRTGKFLYCRLPSGRLLSYPHPAIEKGKFDNDQVTCYTVDSVTRKWGKRFLYSGLYAENITQAVARDLMAEAILRCEAAGYTIVLSVHDELIAEVPEDFGSVGRFEALMCELPAWAKGLPLRAEGWQGKRYRK